MGPRTSPKVDPRNLKSAELLQLINSTPLGTVITERKIFSHRMAAGLRIAPPGHKDNKRIDLVRYAAWLCEQRHSPPHERAQTDANAHNAATDYKAHKERARERQFQMSKSGRDIAPDGLPPPKDPARRAKALEHARNFGETYFRNRFPLPWSKRHLEFWDEIDHTIHHGGQRAKSMPRGSGKTTIIEVATIFAIAKGIRKFPVPLGPTLRDALKMLRSIKVELETNDLLAEDFPEMCRPVRALEGIAQRAKGQLCQGQRTNIEWASNYIVLATIPGAACSGAIIEPKGITGALRGMRHTLADGTIVRPDLVLADDIQTKQSAKSPVQCANREEILHGDVLGLAGPGRKIACFLTCTVIVKGDVADRVLDRKIRPQWQGERVAFVESFPTNTKLWDQYAELRRQGLRDNDHGKAATEFYRKHRAAMDAGAKVYWNERYDADEISAIQHAMNKMIDDEASFWAEYQNDPRPTEEVSAGRLTVKELEAKAASGGTPRGLVPLHCHKLVAFIDVQDKALWWMVCAFGEHFTGAIVDCGVYPEQGRAYFTKSDMKRTYKRLVPGGGFNAQLYAALQTLCTHLRTREFKNENGLAMTLSAAPMIDANWGKSTDVIFQFCRESRAGIPSHGKGIGASQRPLNEYEKKPGDQVGSNWRIPQHAPRGARYVLWDTNFWKTFAADRLRAPHGDQGSVTLPKEARGGIVDIDTRMLIDHLTSEYPVQVNGRGRIVDEWKLTPGRDNELWDCFVGCCVAASIAGISTVGQQASPQRQRLKLSQLQASRRAAA